MADFLTNTRMIWGYANRALPQYLTDVTFSGFTLASGSHEDMILYPDQPYKALVAATTTADPVITIQFSTGITANAIGFINHDILQKYNNLIVEHSSNGSTWTEAGTLNLANARYPTGKARGNPNMLLRFGVQLKAYWRITLDGTNPWPLFSIGSIWLGVADEVTTNPNSGQILRPREYQTRRKRAAGGAPYWTLNKQVRPMDLELTWAYMQQNELEHLLNAVMAEPAGVIACITPEQADLVVPNGVEHWFGRATVVTPAAVNHPGAGAGNHFETVTVIGQGVM